jgi:hypothetical protein
MIDFYFPHNWSIGKQFNWLAWRFSNWTRMGFHSVRIIIEEPR